MTSLKAVFVACVLGCIATAASAETYTSFELPRSDEISSGLATVYISGISPSNATALTVQNLATGSWTAYSMDAAGVATPLLADQQETVTLSMSASGTILGTIYTGDGYYWTRTPDGVMSTFGTEVLPLGTALSAINDSGMFAGALSSYQTGESAALFNPDATTLYEFPTSDTQFLALNDSGDAGGSFVVVPVSNPLPQDALIRFHTGQVVQFNLPNIPLGKRLFSVNKVAVTGINASGVSIGNAYTVVCSHEQKPYCTEEVRYQRAFIRATDGTIVQITAPSLAPPELQRFENATASGINSSGTVVGWENGVKYGRAGDYTILPTHSFMSDAAGNVKLIDPPKAVSSKAYSINDAGVIAGIWWDSANVAHGYIRTP